MLLFCIFVYPNEGIESPSELPSFRLRHIELSANFLYGFVSFIDFYFRTYLQRLRQNVIMSSNIIIFA